jgi:hypothetical protein
MEIPTTPENFISIIRDFTTDLSRTFPEYKYLWTKWESLETSTADYDDLYKYCLSVYPERFFDILYQNDEIFTTTETTPDKPPINTVFLPYVDFKLLFQVDNVSELTKKTIWKYLQLIMVTIMGGIEDKSLFGNSANLFDGIEEEDLHSKLAETISSLSDFFKSSGIDGENNAEFKSMFENMNMPDISGIDTSSMPNPDDLNDHIKNLFGGKIGSLAKELAEELSEDVMEMFGGKEHDEELKSTQDILKKIMRNPAKMMELLKTVSSKIDKKMKSGEISQTEIMKEAGDIMGKMKEMGGGKEFQEMMRNMTKGMAGKGAKFDKGAMTRMMQSESTKERMRNKLQSKVKLEQSQTNPENLVFKIDGDEGQEKSSAKQLPNDELPNDDWLDEVSKPVPSASKKNKKKKSKK